MMKSKLLHIIGLLFLWQGLYGYCAQDAWTDSDKEASYQGVIRKNLELRKIVQELEKKYSDLENERKVLILHVKELQETRDLTDRVIRDLKDRITKLRTEMIKDPNLSATIEALNQQINAAIRERDQLQKNMDDLGTQKEKLAEELKILKQTFEMDMMKTLKPVKAERDDLKAKNQQLNYDLTEARRTMETRIQSSDDARKKLEEAINQTRLRYEEKEKLAEELKTSKQELEMGANQTLKEIKAERDDLKAKNQQLNHDLTEARRTEEKNQQLADEFQEKQKALAKMETDLNAQTQQRTSEKNRLEDELKNVTVDKTMFETKVKELGERVLTAETKVKTLEEALQKTTAEESSQEAEIMALKEKKSELEQKLVRYIEKMLDREEAIKKRDVLERRSIPNDQDIVENLPQERSTKIIAAQSKEEMARQKLTMHYNMALAYDKMGMYKEEEREYRICLKINPKDAHVHYNLGILYDDKLNMNLKAVEHYKKFLELRPIGEEAEQVKDWILHAQQEERLGVQMR